MHHTIIDVLSKSITIKPATSYVILSAVALGLPNLIFNEKNQLRIGLLLKYIFKVPKKMKKKIRKKLDLDPLLHLPVTSVPLSTYH